MIWAVPLDNGRSACALPHRVKLLALRLCRPNQISIVWYVPANPHAGRFQRTGGRWPKELNQVKRSGIGLRLPKRFTYDGRRSRRVELAALEHYQIQVIPKARSLERRSIQGAKLRIADFRD